MASSSVCLGLVAVAERLILHSLESYRKSDLDRLSNRRTAASDNRHTTEEVAETLAEIAVQIIPGTTLAIPPVLSCSERARFWLAASRRVAGASAGGVSVVAVLRRAQTMLRKTFTSASHAPARVIDLVFLPLAVVLWRSDQSARASDTQSLRWLFEQRMAGSSVIAGGKGEDEATRAYWWAEWVAVETIMLNKTSKAVIPTIRRRATTEDGTKVSISAFEQAYTTAHRSIAQLNSLF